MSHKFQLPFVKWFYSKKLTRVWLLQELPVSVSVTLPVSVTFPIFSFDKASFLSFRNDFYPRMNFQN